MDLWENGDMYNTLPAYPTNRPCSEYPSTFPPSFVCGNYYCESGLLLAGSDYHTSDPLSDGNYCSDNNNNCCSEPSLPWFYHQIPQTTSEDIETRIYRHES